MGKKPRVRYELDCGGIRNLKNEEIKAILRATDEIIATGGRNVLAKILKGSKDKKVLEYDLDKCPTYGFYKDLTLKEITYRVDWMIKTNYIEIQYSDRLPMLVFSDKGWGIERETYAEELFQKLIILLKTKNYSFVNDLKDRNRGMILLLIDKVKATGNPGFIPLLKYWQEIECKKVHAKIQNVIDYLVKTVR